MKVFDHSERKDGTFSRADFAYDAEANVYVPAPAAKQPEEVSPQLLHAARGA